MRLDCRANRRAEVGNIIFSAVPDQLLQVTEVEGQKGVAHARGVPIFNTKLSDVVSC